MHTGGISLCLLLSIAAAPQSRAETEYLSDSPLRMLTIQQGWGELGLNTCAHASGQPGLPLAIGDHKYAKGLGHHAPGEIVVDLGGGYEGFTCDVGLQPLPGNAGSVVFKVFVDDELRFDSGVMRAGEAPRPVSVALGGAMELRLVVEDAGDGINSDCANWADARLTPAAGAKVKPASLLDVAPFGRIVSSDPKRTTGSRADRVHEYHADDVFLETELLPDANESYVLPAGQCIGVNWPERRMLRELQLELERPPAGDAQVQCWVGESPWQGRWQPLPGKMERTDNGFAFHVDWSQAASQPEGTRVLPIEARTGTRKIRWFLPGTGEPVTVRKLAALTATRLRSSDVILESESASAARSASAGKAAVEIYNGTMAPIEAGGNAGPALRKVDWDMTRPLALRVQYTHSARNDASTVLRIYTPQPAFGVAIDDLLDRGYVYVLNAGVFVRRAGGPTLEQYRQRVAGKQTVLRQVREAPDQTLASAMASLHSPAQDRQPTLLSLACDNHKFIVHRDGVIQFSDAPDSPDRHECKFPFTMRPQFGSGKNAQLARYLEDGWLPVPVTQVRENGISYRQQTMVAPMSRANQGTGTPLCISEFGIYNASENPAEFSLKLGFLNTSDSNPAVIREENEFQTVEFNGRVLALVKPGQVRFRMTVENGTTTLRGSLLPGDSAGCAVYIPSRPAEASSFRPPVDPLQDVRAHWQATLGSAAQMNLPDPLLMNIIKASQVHCLMAARNEESGKRIAAWTSSLAYGPLESESHSVIRGMDALGHTEFARKSLDYFIKRYDPAGFCTTGYTLIGTGWNLWTVAQHYQLAQDTEWLRQIAPDIARACKWIIAQRGKTKRLDAAGNKVPEYGLMPPGVMADWNAFAYYFCLNGYYYAGLHGAATALADIDYPGAQEMLAEAAAFRKDIISAYHRTQMLMPVYPLRDGSSVIGYPSQLHTPGPTGHFFPGEDGNRSWCYDVELGAHQLVPQGVLDPRATEVRAMLDHMEDVQFLSDGWFDFPAEQSRKDPFTFGGFSKVQPYYCRNAEIYAMRDDVKPFIRSYFNTISTLVGLENLCLQEHFKGVGAWNKTHETGYFLLYTRLMLVQERGQELWLAPFVTSGWLKDGMHVGLQNAPTEFGAVTYRITSKAAGGHMDAIIDVPGRTPPQAVVLRLRHPDGRAVQRATVEGDHGAVETSGDIIRIARPLGRIKVTAAF